MRWEPLRCVSFFFLLLLCFILHVSLSLVWVFAFSSPPAAGCSCWQPKKVFHIINHRQMLPYTAGWRKAELGWKWRGLLRNPANRRRELMMIFSHSHRAEDMCCREPTSFPFFFFTCPWIGRRKIVMNLSWNSRSHSHAANDDVSTDCTNFNGFFSIGSKDIHGIDDDNEPCWVFCGSLRETLSIIFPSRFNDDINFNHGCCVQSDYLMMKLKIGARREWGGWGWVEFSVWQRMEKKLCKVISREG